MKKTTGVHSIKIHILLGVLLAAVVGFIIWLYTGYQSEASPYELNSYAMGTYIQQTVYGDNAQQAASNAVNAVTKLEDEISWRYDGSDIQKLNAKAGNGPVTVSKDTFELLSRCLEVAKASGGLFDPTILPISSLWDFGGDNQQVPSTEAIGQFLPYVNYEDLILDSENRTAALRKELEAVDLGAAGKGAACDAVMASYRNDGVKNAVVAVGGSIGVMGKRLTQSTWRIAVRDPDKSAEDADPSMGVLELSEGYVSTSGVYEHSFEQDGAFYHHLLNPTTGYPEENGLLSVTVTADNGAVSDILSTACFLPGREKSLALLEKYNAEAIFIEKDKSVYVTSGLKEGFSVTSGAYTLKEWN